jgi:hypothetical protein
MNVVFSNENEVFTDGFCWDDGVSHAYFCGVKHFKPKSNLKTRKKMKELDLKAIAELMNKSCNTNIDVTELDGKFLTGDEDGELSIIDRTIKTNGGTEK